MRLKMGAMKGKADAAIELADDGCDVLAKETAVLMAVEIWKKKIGSHDHWAKDKWGRSPALCRAGRMGKLLTLIPDTRFRVTPSAQAFQ